MQDGAALGLKPQFSILDSDDVTSILKDAGGTTDRHTNSSELSQWARQLGVAETRLPVRDAHYAAPDLSHAAIAVNLEDEMAIPAIKAEAPLIHAVATDDWWQDVTVPMLETVRRRLRALIKLLPKAMTENPILYPAAESLSVLEFGAAETLTNPDRAELMARFKSA